MPIMFHFVNHLLAGNICDALFLILMSFCNYDMCHNHFKSENLYTCFKNFIAFNIWILHDQLLKYCIIQRYALFFEAVRGVFAFC